jgi:hypothetical protein
MRIDKNMRVHIDEARRNQTTRDTDRLAGLIGRQRWCDRGDFATGNANIHHAAQIGARIEHLTARQQQIVFHRSPPSFGGWSITAWFLASRRHAILRFE